MRILPTMNRPDRCQIALDSMIASGITTPGAVIVNGPQRIDEYRKLRLPNNWHMFELPENIGVCGALNFGLRRFPGCDWYSLAADDEIVHSAGFDIRLAEAAGRWNIANANDGWQSTNRIWSFVTIGGDLVRSMGYLAPPGLWHYYWDDFVEHVAADLNLRRFLPDIKTEHRHHYANTAPDDKTYQEGRSRWDQDKARFERWKLEEWQEIRNRVRLEMTFKPEPKKPLGDWLTCINRGGSLGVELNCGCNIDKTFYHCRVNGKCLKRLPPGQPRSHFGTQLDGVTECHGCLDAE